MEYRNLGQCGLKISALSLVSWLTIGDSIDQRSAQNIVNTAIDSGINFFDMADGYANGEAEKKWGHC